jgi:hypothetical protein
MKGSSSRSSVRKTPMNEFIELMIQSKVISDKALTITSYNFMALGLVMTIISLIIFQQLTDLINILASPNTNNTIFDRRYGYTTNEVIETLQSWGSRGRIYYLIIEIWDMTFYFSSYCAAFIVIINRTTNDIIKNNTLTDNNIYYLKKFGHFPQILVLIDTMEDIFQILMTVVYHCDLSISPSLFSAIVFSGSIFNRIKWNLVPIGMSTLLILIGWMIFSNISEFYISYNNIKKKKQ